ncbi:SMI1/KNR4 family protein [Asanoa siamensis]|uniref:SMI1/KNR4 family protein SUKH-1 n=1 Tax=Asanoa siamensis TaxID=926357 RepID=A0ABQ4CZF3_9ACTN|nr:SMI1/KNR4 family protein [Asanoa siamensis]GIF76667.1 hypothetical protein Asi02nite_61850 [Asanoa siamensis]
MIFDVVAGLGQLDTRDDAWRFVRAFAAAWATPVDAADDVTDAELDAVEERLGVRLPEAVREGYRLVGRHRHLTSRHDDLYELDELEYDRGDGMLEFRCTHQGDGVLLRAAAAVERRPAGVRGHPPVRGSLLAQPGGPRAVGEHRGR